MALFVDFARVREHFIDPREILVDERRNVRELLDIRRQLLGQIHDGDAVAGARVHGLRLVRQIKIRHQAGGVRMRRLL
jgi:hypothetical protein